MGTETGPAAENRRTQKDVQSLPGQTKSPSSMTIIFYRGSRRWKSALEKSSHVHVSTGRRNTSRTQGPQGGAVLPSPELPTLSDNGKNKKYLPCLEAHHALATPILVSAELDLGHSAVWDSSSAGTLPIQQLVDSFRLGLLRLLFPLQDCHPIPQKDRSGAEGGEVPLSAGFPLEPAGGELENTIVFLDYVVSGMHGLRAPPRHCKAGRNHWKAVRHQGCFHALTWPQSLCSILTCEFALQGSLPFSTECIQCVPFQML